ncbi:PREDICTED: uncharacterized protein At3g28850-like [Tarenaya hassleriana]|uniref:uncharacterized protein At3g28850-like n=1 Tax=Tarenaya hassleriana TaxID=28532 RepID=UPI00053C1E1E|nr:PREDICTED: uncharacterized protein At3g28850-like [Tarenaya hassleriana]XP_019057498.1 PREDICTED: uncharacterized protein At3g28850-like [Tarenaya hassleriana]
MGCASSKKHKCCRHCRRGLSPAVAPRSYSMHVHHPGAHTGGSYDMVALTSSTIGSLKLCDTTSLGHNSEHLEDFTSKLLSKDNNGGNKLVVGVGFHRGEGGDEVAETKRDKVNSALQAKLEEAKVWSRMMNRKIPKILPKTPTLTPPGEPETINTWELMDGLEDVSPLREHKTVEPLMFQMEEDELDCSVLDFDPEIISCFRKSLQELPPDHPFHIRIPDMGENPNVGEHEEGEKPGKDKVILYFTTLRGIRKTYEDCCHVRVILKGLGIRVDERDVSMHSGFKEEMKELLGDEFDNNGAGIRLPRVFLGKKYLGGAEGIRKLNEDGKLEKLLEGCERVEDDNGGYECEACGDLRFLPCDKCSGSRKVYYECEEEEEEFGFQRCLDCNENGLIRCPVCL